MTAEIRRPQRRRWLIISGLVVGIVGLSAIHAYRRHVQVQALVADIRGAGGYVDLKQSALARLLNEQRLFDETDWTCVNLDGARIDSNWLRERDDLAALEIDELGFSTNPPPDDIVRLVARQQLVNLAVCDAVSADEIVRAVSGSRRLREVRFPRADMTDKGFRLLPMEQLAELDVSQSHVTADALLALRRCRRLESIDLDNRQFTPEIADILAGIPTLRHLQLIGEDVSDEDLRLLRPFTQLTILSLRDTSVTSEGVQELSAAITDCDIRMTPEIPGFLPQNSWTDFLQQPGQH